MSTVCAQLDSKDTRSNCWPLFSAALQSAQAAGDCGSPSVNLIGNSFGVAQKWSSGLLAPDGLVYGVVESTPRLLQIDPTTQMMTEFPIGATGWLGPFSGPLV